MANTAYYSKSVGNVESVFFIAKDNSKGQEKMALYKVEDAAKVVDSLRYTEVRQVDLQQLMMLKELLDEMTESGGVVSRMLTSQKDLAECLMSLEPMQNNKEDDTSSILFKCPYCPRSFQNNMTLHVLKLHMMKVHRIQCVESFTCPKCKHRVLDSSSSDDATVSIDTKENIDPNIANQVFQPMGMEVAGEEVVEQPLVIMMRDECREVVQVVVEEDAKAIISYENVREYSCNVCNYQSSHKTHVKNHIKWVHQKIKDKTCPHCEFKCYQNGHLRSHIKRVHQQIKDFMCPDSECKYSTGSKQDLKKHVRTIHERIKIVQPKNFSCMECQFRTATRNSLDQHVKTVHNNIRDFSCPQCEQCFGQKGARDKHIKAVHEKIKDNSCPHCDYRTSYKNILDRHVKSVHEKIRNFNCSECESQFFDNHGLTKHLKAVHQKIKAIHCNMCSYQCSQKPNIRRHMKSVHGVDWINKFSD